MAKLGSFFRRLFSPLFLDDPDLSTSDSCKSDVPIISSASPSVSSTAEFNPIDIRSSTATPTPNITKQRISHSDQMDDTLKSNYLSSDSHRSNIRRLSAPLLIQTSPHPHHPHPQCPSTIVNQSTEQALITPLQRSSFSSTPNTVKIHSNSSAHSLTATNSGGAGSSASLLSRPENRSASFNVPTLSSSINYNPINNIASSSGRCTANLLLSLSCIFLTFLR